MIYIKSNFFNARIKSSVTLRKMTHKVFVYGTLKRNEPNHHWLTDPKNGVGNFMTEGKTKSKYPLIIGTRYNIPFLLQAPGKGHHVKGEIYEVDDLMLSKLDILEDHPNYYVREVDDIVPISGSQSENVKCWVYFLKNFRQELLSKQQFECYSSNGDHGLKYMENTNRDPNDDYYSEVKR
ncbi:hypothetical protein KGM_210201 [Danaus plexippus plexippus]|uniref:Gamma-glutamylcyclotransferase family protein n=1 Tax=Danaus plexippus plexippus TaxID=278856 RepID=A0A212FDM6_DANPL|nr:hypothetical protein KGM_210201 [Danaus plexippus plexippus]